MEYVGVCGVYKNVEPIEELEYEWHCGVYRSVEPIGECESGLWSVQECGAHWGVGVCGFVERTGVWSLLRTGSVEYVWDCGVYRSVEPIEEWVCGV